MDIVRFGGVFSALFFLAVYLAIDILTILLQRKHMEEITLIAIPIALVILWYFIQRSCKPSTESSFVEVCLAAYVIACLYDLHAKARAMSTEISSRISPLRSLSLEEAEQVEGLKTIAFSANAAIWFFSISATMSISGTPYC